MTISSQQHDEPRTEPKEGEDDRGSNRPTRPAGGEEE